MLNRLKAFLSRPQDAANNLDSVLAGKSKDKPPTPLTASQALQANGEVLLEASKLAEATECFSGVLAINPEDVDANIGLGRTFRAKGLYREAERCLRRAIAADPEHGGSRYFLGGIFHAQNRLGDAIQEYRHAISLNPKIALAYRDLGIVYYERGKMADAMTILNEGIAVNPGAGELHFCIGNFYLERSDFRNALSSFECAVLVSPRNAAWLLNRGVALQMLQEFEEALQSYEQALHIDPDYADAHSNRGSVLLILKRHQDALDSVDQAIKLKPDHSDAHKYRGWALRFLQRSEEALSSLALALKINPKSAEALHIRALALHDLQRHQEALHSFAKYLQLNPNDAEGHRNEGLCRLQMGDFAKGWPKYEWRRKTAIFKNEFRRPDESPLWLGEEPLAGKTLLLQAEQGLGDTIQFCRYVDQAVNLGATVLLEVQPLLKSLLAPLKGASQVFVRGDACPAHDYHCQLLSLPFAFKTQLNSIPANIPYLQSDPERIRHWGIKLGAKNKPRVGIAWSGNAAHENDHNRSIPLASLAKIISSRAQFVCLQKDLRTSDQAAMSTMRDDITFLDGTINDFSDTAALIDLMDVVISVDTAVAHLAGALGKPLWLLLPFRSDFRWLLERGDSPWYPTATLFRQRKSSDWDSVLDTVSATLMEAFEGSREYQSSGTDKLLSGPAKT
ncbi:MAG TPA: tetratricopeptide repeat protein [Usitatibacteraceae bacterium]